MESREGETGATRLHFLGFLRSGALSRFGHSGLADRAGCKPRFFLQRGFLPSIFPHSKRPAFDDTVTDAIPLYLYLFVSRCVKTSNGEPYFIVEACSHH